MRRIGTLDIHQKTPWGFFDGTCQGKPGVCAAGDALFLSDSLYFSFKLGLGRGSNNWAELGVLEALLRIAMEQGENCLQVFKD